MNLDEFRLSYINEDIIVEATNNSRYPTEVFIDNATDILINDYSLLNDNLLQCYFSYQNETHSRVYKSMYIDAANVDLLSNTVNLLLADYNSGGIKNITNEFIRNKAQLLLNFFENSLNGFFNNAEESSPEVQIANSIRSNITSIYKIHLFIVSTNQLSKVVKNLELPDFVFQNQRFKVALDVLDIGGIYRTKLANFKKEDIVINCSDFGIKGIPCIKADIETDQYESYLAIVPGAFLSDIYKKYSSSLLESNVRSFLKFNGGVNKGIKQTILNEKSKFFTYNNGISTIAKSINTINDKEKGLLITSFTDLQIINGGQTTATLAATSIKYNADLSGIFVQMKLTIQKDSDPNLIRDIAKYANSQNKVKNADLNSSHPFYQRIEDYSRKIFAPLLSGQIVQQLWFFERARGQYEQPLMQMTKAQQNDYKLIRPKKQKFTLVDLAKYCNASEMLPHYVSWGGEVNAAHFHEGMREQWDKDNSIYNELYFKELIGKKILFSYIENLISEQNWYQEKKAYRPQIVAYTFSKLAYEVKNINKHINYKQIWDLQKVPDIFYNDLSIISKIVFDSINDDNRSTANIETYCKREECWNIVKKKPYILSAGLVDILLDESDKKIEIVQAKKEQKFTNGINNEIDIFSKGSNYWRSLIERGKTQEVLTYGDISALESAINYCNGVFNQLSKHQIKEIIQAETKLNDNKIL